MKNIKNEKNIFSGNFWSIEVKMPSSCDLDIGDTKWFDKYIEKELWWGKFKDIK